MRSFQGKVAAVTGAASGIGRALATALADAGAEVALADLRPDELAETAALCRARGARVSTTTLDVADRAAVYAWADAVAAEHGRVNLVFNNAGVALACSLEHVDDADLEWIMGVNFWGVVHGTRAFLPHLRASGEGHVVNLSSLFGMMALPGHGAYNASKFAVRGFTEALRQELELGGAPVSATCVHPGGVKTNIARDARYRQAGGMPDEETGKRAFSAFFITTPEQAARTILRAVLRNQRRVLIGRDAFAGDLLVRVAPSAYQLFTMRLSNRMKEG